MALDVVFEKQQLDDGEFLEVEFFDFDSVLQMINDNIIKDSKTVITMLKAKDLFAK